MAAIYEPRGAAREYSPLALNYIKGCDHGCVYCYVPKMMKRFNKDYVHSDVYMKEIEKLDKEILASARKYRNSDKQVFLSFTTDPYSHFNNDTKYTRQVLEILLEHRIPVSILTKGGYNVLQDMDVIKRFGKNIQVGASLTFVNKDLSKKWEKNSSDPLERFETLEILHSEGVRTWASMEPVIFPEQSLEIIDITQSYVDGFKIGKLNHFKKHEDKFDWNDFLKRAVDKMRMYNKLFYVKKDLMKFHTDDILLNDFETDMDYLAITNQFEPETLF